MFGIALLSVLGWVGLLSAVGVIDRDSDDEDDTPDPVEPVNRSFTVTDGAEITGTTGDDTVTADPAQDNDFGRFEDVLVDTGAGDDLIDLAPSPDFMDDPQYAEGILAHSTIEAGGGDDTITAQAEWSSIVGGTGDDVLAIHTGYNTVSGGFGDDMIEVAGVGGSIFGADGDDTIDATGFDAGTIYGGNGDDLILISSDQDNDDIDGARGNGGNDTIRVDTHFPIFSSAPAQGVSGGTGADLFDITFSAENGSGNPGLDIDFIAPGQNLTPTDVVRISDFTPGVDILQVDPSLDDPDYELTAVKLVEYDHLILGPSTDLVFTYEKDGLIRDAVINLHGVTDVVWDDIELQGVDPAVLQPVGNAVQPSASIL